MTVSQEPRRWWVFHLGWAESAPVCDYKDRLQKGECIAFLDQAGWSWLCFGQDGTTLSSAWPDFQAQACCDFWFVSCPRFAEKIFPTTRLGDNKQQQFEMLILTLGGGTRVRGGRAPCRSHLWSRENSWVQSHCPAGVNKSNQQCHGHSKGSILAVFLTKHTQFFLWETNRRLACEGSSCCSCISFQNSLRSTKPPWPQAKILGAVCKAANYRICWMGSNYPN